MSRKVSVRFFAQFVGLASLGLSLGFLMAGIFISLWLFIAAALCFGNAAIMLFVYDRNGYELRCCKIDRDWARSLAECRDWCRLFVLAVCPDRKVDWENPVEQRRAMNDALHLARRPTLVLIDVCNDASAPA